MFACLECGKKFRTDRAAYVATENGCPKCGGYDIDLDVSFPYLDKYREAKAEVGNAVLLFRVGDFYEAFYDDAKTIASTLGLALTSSTKNGDAVPMAGFPYHHLESYLAKLIAAGFRAAVCDLVNGKDGAK